MGDRCTIQFANKSGDKSGILYSHWDGKYLVELAEKYVKELKELKLEGVSEPLDRLEVDSVMFNFIWCVGHRNVYTYGEKKHDLYASKGNYRVCDKYVEDFDAGHNLVYVD